MAEMSLSDAVGLLGAGFTEGNIMVQITHQPMYEDKVANTCDYGAYTYAPIICANDGVLRIAQRDFQGTDGRYYGVIQRISGLGDSFDGLLTGGPKAGAGSLDLVLDGSPVMDEARLVNWDAQIIEARWVPLGTEWADGLEIGQGMVTDGEVRKSGNQEILSLRLTGNEWRLRERYQPDAYTNKSGSAQELARAPFGYCPRFPVYTDGSKSGSDFVYGVSMWGSVDTLSYAMYTDDDGGTGHTDSNPNVVMTDSDSWDTSGSPTATPTNRVYAACKGYDTGGFVYRPGEILSKAISVLKGYDQDINVVDSLADVTLDSAAFAEYDSRCNYNTGYLFDGKPDGQFNDDFDGQIATSYSWEQTTWEHAFEHLVGGSGGLWCFNREGELGIHWLLGPANTETEVLTLSADKGDWDKARSSYLDVENIDRVEGVFSWTFPDNSSDNEYEAGAIPFYQNNGEIKTVKLAPTITNSAQYEDFLDDYLYRFGRRDMKLTDCPLARVLNVGDVVKLVDSDDDHLGASGAKGHVIGVDRGSSPFVEVRI